MDNNFTERQLKTIHKEAHLTLMRLNHLDEVNLSHNDVDKMIEEAYKILHKAYEIATDRDNWSAALKKENQAF